MTREEAIRQIRDNIDFRRRLQEGDKPQFFDVDENEKDIEAFEMAIKSLSAEPCEDAISRHAVLDGLASIAKAKAKSDAQKSLMGRVMFFTEHLSPVTPKQETGHWEWLTEDKYRCSNCNHETRVDECMNKPLYDFCPFCGAKMEVSENG